MKYLHLISLVVVVIFISKATTIKQQGLSTDKTSQYCNDMGMTIYGNYCLVQPGLCNIYNQILENNTIINKDSCKKNFDIVYPHMLRMQLSEKQLKNIDTLRYNWNNDTIICKNFTDIVTAVHSQCDLISSLDSVRIFDVYDNPLFTHGYVMDVRYKSKYIDVLKKWDENIINEICRSSGIFSSGSIDISRIIIKDGKLTDVKYKTCVDIEYEKLIDK